MLKYPENNMKISIVTPSFNQGEFLEETIQSVICQKYKNFEYIIIDGGSTDNSVEIIEKYKNNLSYWISEKDHGHGDALNKGFAKSTGEIMAWINSDDKYTPWAFSTVSQIFQEFPHVEWIVGYNSWWNIHGSMIKAKRVPVNIYDYLIGNSSWIQQESVFWRRSLWERAGGYIDSSFKFMVDGELWSRFFLHSDLYSVDSILGGYRMHGKNRALENWEKCNLEMISAIKKMKLEIDGDVIQRAKFLKMAKFINRNFFFKSSFFSKVFCEIFKFPMYKNLQYEDGIWKEKKLPFRLR
ncbi:glycosyltransferase family 2 protein [Geoalkalibacter sp.]|uniref:glycosyltransferase family 2 protein n=1 Tax=Geoalkalibacter sp. TaxID=3041440 RepID=UPI00272E5E90|nr:glycosyltransferase family 2 protein [Geoalkalibacter sp.]